MRPFIVILLLLAAAAMQVKAQDYNVMFYNVENLFDTADDTTKDDDEFMPEGSRRWTEKRYWQKINALSRVIAAAGGWELPALIGLCEVENEDVLKDLAYGSILSTGGYGIVHRESPDSRGIDPALLYRRDLVRISDCRSWVPEVREGAVFNSRNLLYVKAIINDDTLHVILCHWPSRRGGVMAAETIREEIANLVRVKEDSIQSATGNKAFIIVMGDFNAAPDDTVMSILTKGGDLVNTAKTLSEKGLGSYRYQGKWEMIDQILVSESMTGTEGPLYADPLTFRVFDA
ncbi:MAG: endonuclease/exonuclease/phosphatase family protein, partial [Bacteroidales bacterium]